MTKTKQNNVNIQGLIILSHNPIPNDTNTQQSVRQHCRKRTGLTGFGDFA